MNSLTEQQPHSLLTRIRAHPNIVVSVLLLVIIVVGYVAIISPLRKKSDELAAYDRNTRTSEIEAKKRQLFSARRTLGATQQYEPETEVLLSDALPNEDQKHDLVVNLTALSELTGMGVKNIAFTEEKIVVRRPEVLERNSPAQRANNVSTLDIQIQLEGYTYTRLRRFLSLVEHNLRLLRVVDFEIDSDSSKGIVNLTTYYAKDGGL